MKLTIGNSTSQLEGLSIEQYRALRHILSYKIEGSYFSGCHNGGRRFLFTKGGFFASGLLYRVIDWLEKSKLVYQTRDLRKPPTRRVTFQKLDFKHEFFPQQRDAVANAVKAHRGTISMPTGSGKSYSMALLISTLKLRTLVIVPNLNLKKQLTATFKEIFGSLKHITIQNIDSGTLIDEKDYDCLIIDEAHHVAAATYRHLNKKAWSGIYHRYFFTATPFRGIEEEQILMESVAGEVVYQLTYHEAVAAKMITPLEAFYIDLPKQEVEGHSWPQVYKELIVNNEHRNKILSDLLSSFRYNKISALCLVKEIAHGEQLKTSLIPFAHGENEETSNLIATFNKGGRCLIGTTGVLGEGVDSKPCEYVILAGLGKSKPSLMQAFGRALRNYPDKVTGKIILIRDSSHKFTLNHYKAQVKVLKDEYGLAPAKLTLD